MLKYCLRCEIARVHHRHDCEELRVCLSAACILQMYVCPFKTTMFEMCLVCDLVLLRVCQVSAPIYKLCMTDLGGEQRFAAAVARRLQSLGALTRGDRRAASGVDLSESNFDSPLGRKSLR